MFLLQLASQVLATTTRRGTIPAEAPLPVPEHFHKLQLHLPPSHFVLRHFIRGPLAQRRDAEALTEARGKTFFYDQSPLKSQKLTA